MGKYAGKWKERQEKIESEARSRWASEAGKKARANATPEARREQAQKAAAARWAKARKSEDDDA